MNLSQYQKEAFIRAVLNDIKEPADGENKRLAQEALVKAMSPEARKLYRKSPKALMTNSYSWITSRWSTTLIVGDVENANEVLKPYTSLLMGKRDLEKSMEAVLKGIRTLKQLKSAFPAYEHHMPSEAEPTKNLPAVDISARIDELMKLSAQAAK